MSTKCRNIRGGDVHPKTVGVFRHVWRRIAVPDTITDLTTASDLELDHALAHGFELFAAAKGDKAKQAKIKAANRVILAEQGRRLDGWLDHTLGLS